MASVLFKMLPKNVSRYCDMIDNVPCIKHKYIKPYCSMVIILNATDKLSFNISPTISPYHIEQLVNAKPNMKYMLFDDRTTYIVFINNQYILKSRRTPSGNIIISILLDKEKLRYEITRMRLRIFKH